MSSFVYVGHPRLGGPDTITMGYRAQGKVCTIDFVKGGDPVQVPEELAVRLRGHHAFCDASSPQAKTAQQSRKAVDEARANLERARQQAEQLEAPPEQQAAPAPKPAPTQQVTIDGGTDQNRAAQQGAPAPRGTGGRRKSVQQ